MAAKEVTYEESIKRLEEIVEKIDNNEIDIDNLHYDYRIWVF